MLQIKNAYDIMPVGKMMRCVQRNAVKTPGGASEGTEKVDYTVYIWYNVSIKYRRCFYDRTTAEIDAKSIHGNQAIYISSNRKSTRIIKTLMDFFFLLKSK